jgi:hypothetical protein
MVTAVHRLKALIFEAFGQQHSDLEVGGWERVRTHENPNVPMRRRRRMGAWMD